MKRRHDRTPEFWSGPPVGLLPAGQLDLPLVQAPREDAKLLALARTDAERRAVLLPSPLTASGLRAYCGEPCRAHYRQRAYRLRETGSTHYVPHGSDFRRMGGPIRRSAARCLATIRNFRHGRAIVGQCVGCGRPMPGGAR